MKIGIITVKDSTFHPNGRLIEEAGRLGHEVVLIDPYRVSCHVGGNGAGIFIGTDAVTGDGPGPGMVLPDLILPRQGSPMGEYGFVLLRQLAMLRVPLVNSLEGVTISKHQYITLQRLFRAGLPVPHAFFVTRQDTFFSAVEALGGFPVVVKQVDGLGGEGVEKLDGPDAAGIWLDRCLNPVKGVVVELFIPHTRDVRLLVAGGKVAAAMALTPAPGQFKANVHQKGIPQSYQPDDTIAEMAVQAARECCLDIAGVDMILTQDQGPMILEVNYSPGFRGLETATGMNIAKILLDSAIAISEKTKGRKS